MELLIAISPVLLGAFLAQLSPGPSLLIVAQTAMSQGRRSALKAVVGIVLGYAIWATLFASGVGALIAAYPELVVMLKICGGAILIWLSFRALQKRSPRAADADAAERPFPAALWVNLTNPKAALIWAATSVFLVSQGPGAVGLGSALIVVSAGFVYGGYAVLFAWPWLQRAYARAARAISTAFAALLGIFGVTLLLQGLREAR